MRLVVSDTAYTHNSCSTITQNFKLQRYKRQWHFARHPEIKLTSPMCLYFPRLIENQCHSLIMAEWSPFAYATTTQMTAQIVFEDILYSLLMFYVCFILFFFVFLILFFCFFCIVMMRRCYKCLSISTVFYFYTFTSTRMICNRFGLENTFSGWILFQRTLLPSNCK